MCTRAKLSPGPVDTTAAGLFPGSPVCCLFLAPNCTCKPTKRQQAASVLDMSGHKQTATHCKHKHCCFKGALIIRLFEVLMLIQFLFLLAQDQYKELNKINFKSSNKIKAPILTWQTIKDKLLSHVDTGKGNTWLDLKCM